MAGNKDQNYLKGYADFIAPEGNNRFKDCKEFIAKFWSDPTYKSGHGKSDNENIDLAVRRMPVSAISRSEADKTQGVDNCGTLHQFFCNSDELYEIMQKTRSNLPNSKSKLSEVVAYLTKSLKNKERVIIGISEKDANCDTTLSPQFRKFAMKIAKMRWATVGIDSSRNKENLKKSSPCQSYEIPDLHKYHIFNYYKKQDHRRLALKIDLYDELRERRFVQPTGVGYAMAEPIMPETEYLHLNALNKWHYTGMFVSASVLDIVLRGNGKLRSVGPECEEWDIRSENVKVIGIDANMKTNGIGFYTWILSHLKYPLLWVIDHYLVRKLGSKESKKQAFVRTAGLVDILDYATKIIFVVSPSDVDQLNFAGYRFSVACVDNRRSFQYGIPTYDMDQPICAMIDECMRHNGSLKAAFTEHTLSYFPNGINWLEISSIANTLIVRWHQKIETNLGASDSDCYSVGAPRDVLTYMDLKPADDISNESYPYYGGLSAVNSLDQRFVNLDKNKQTIHIFLGSWNTASELALFTGHATYDAENTEDPKEIAARLEDGGHDRLIRGSWLRCGFEHFKRLLGVRDVIAFPKVGANGERYWSKLIGFNGEPTGSCTSWFANDVISNNVVWNWLGNLYADTDGCTLTGTRTLSHWWRSVENTEWSTYSPMKYSNLRKDSFKMTEKFDNNYIQVEQEKYAYKLEKVLMRSDMHRWQHLRGRLTYYVQATKGQDANVPWCVDSTFPGKLATELGWKRFFDTAPVKGEVWGWGVTIHARDEEFGVLKTLLLPRELCNYVSRERSYGKDLLYQKSISIDINNFTYHCIGWQAELSQDISHSLRNRKKEKTELIIKEEM